MEKKKYEKPKVEVVEIQLSECIAGSVQTNATVNVLQGSRSTTSKEVKQGGASWDASF